MDDFSECDHPVRVAGMCAVCGKVVDDIDAGSSGGQQLHDFSGVQISDAEAARLDSESTRQLLAQHKLALIVDLDQTIIHATVDPTVGEWMKDEQNPNNPALADVGKFMLGVDGKEVLNHSHEGTDSSDSATAEANDGCWYYVKPRPGLQAFLHRLSKIYEMHVYTMGTRTYAESVCRLVDPDGAVFGARIISRDENGSLVQKSLKKLFPVDTSMVVIIDDRADVWQWSPNLVRVVPFDFFVGIGDINASFLPTLSSVPSPTPEKESGDHLADSADEVKEIDGSAEAKAKAEEDAAMTVAEESQKNVVNEHLGARPLAKMQEALQDKSSDGGWTGAAPVKPAAVLKETDRELDKLQEILEDVHKRWYSDYAARGAKPEEKPSITDIVSSRKSAVLNGCTIVFSSVAPMHQDPGTTDLWRLATEFGATCKRAIDDSVTHIVAAKQGTEKVIAGQRRGLHVVWFTWLQDSCAHWYKQDERQYVILQQVGREEKSEEGAIANRQQEARADDLNGAEGEAEAEEADDDDQGFGDLDWDEANDEVDAVLEGLSEDDFGDYEDEEEGEQDGSQLGDDSDRDSETASNGGPHVVKRRRSARSDQSDASTDSKKDQQTLSPLSKRRRMAELRAGQSKLKQVLIGEVDGTSASSRANSEMVDDASTLPAAATEDGETDTDFLQSLEDELELQLGADDSGEVAA